MAETLTPLRPAPPRAALRILALALGAGLAGCGSVRTSGAVVSAPLGSPEVAIGAYVTNPQQNIAGAEVIAVLHNGDRILLGSTHADGRLSISKQRCRELGCQVILVCYLGFQCAAIPVFDPATQFYQRREMQIELAPASVAEIRHQRDLVPCRTTPAEGARFRTEWNEILAGHQADAGGRPPGSRLAARFIARPDELSDERDTAVSLYLPEIGRAVVELVVAPARAAERAGGGAPDVRRQSLDRRIAVTIAALVEGEIRQATYPQDSTGTLIAHPDRHYFVTWRDGYGEMCGFAEAPEDDSRAGRLVRLGEALRRYSETGTNSAAVEKAIEELLGRDRRSP